MQSRNNPNFYLKHNFEKEYSDLGTPYVQENCDIAESDNLVIYGHHIKGGKMFGALEDYKSKSFYEEHKTIQFDTLTEQTEYEIRNITFVKRKRYIYFRTAVVRTVSGIQNGHLESDRPA